MCKSGVRSEARKTLGTLEQKFQVVVSHLMKVLEMNPGSSAKALNVPNHGAISPATYS